MSARTVARAVLGACFRYSFPPIVGEVVHDLAFGPAFDRLWPALEEPATALVAVSFEGSLPGSLALVDEGEAQRALAAQTLTVIESWEARDQRSLKARVRSLAQETESAEQQALAQDVLSELSERLLTHEGFRSALTERIEEPRGRLRVPQGSELAGRYKVLSELGRGGMGLVLRVADRLLREREFAMKISLRDEGPSAARFEREAVIGHELQSEPGFLGASHYGELEIGGRSRPFIVMRLVSAARSLNLQDPSRAQRLFTLQAASKRVARLHELGYVHRDLKPQNFLVDGKGEVLLSDFGLARRVGAEPGLEARLTRTGQGLGTPLYMAPEQEDGGSVDQRADVYSLGVMLLEAWEGKRPRRNDLLRLLYQRPESLLTSPDWYELLRGTLVDSAARIPTAREFLARLSALLERGVDSLADNRRNLEKEFEERLERELAQRLALERRELRIARERAESLERELESARGEISQIKGLATARAKAPSVIDSPMSSGPGLSRSPDWSILRDLESWDRSTKIDQDSVIHALERNKNLELSECRVREYFCQGQSHRIASFRHRSGLDLNLIPGGTLKRGFDDIREAQAILRDDFLAWGQWDHTNNKGPEGPSELAPSHFSDAPFSELRIPPILIGVSPVTQSQWQSWTGESLVSMRDKIDKSLILAGEGPENPVYYVDWNEACRESQKRGLRLPSEAEWEWMARGGSEALWCFGNDLNELDRYAWTWRNSRDGTKSVRMKRPNAFGIYDAHGNVWEWCADAYGPYQATDSAAPRGGTAALGRVVRGGSWFFSALESCAAYRGRNSAAVKRPGLGFRVALSLPLD